MKHDTLPTITLTEVDSEASSLYSDAEASAVISSETYGFDRPGRDLGGSAELRQPISLNSLDSVDSGAESFRLCLLADTLSKLSKP